MTNTTAPPETEVALIGMCFHVCVGILPHEREYAQPMEIDLIVRHAAREPLDYGRLYDIASRTVDQDERTFLEPIAEKIAQQSLALPMVSWCRVVIRKPHVALGGPLRHAQIAIERQRA